MTAPELYFHLIKTFEQNGIEDARFEAMCIIEHIFGMKIHRILLEKRNVDENQRDKADRIALKRIEGEPLQYLIGEWEFYGLPFYVGEGVLIPRPDTETLVDAAIEQAQRYTAPEIIDLCSGSGCIAAALAKNIPEAAVSAVELSEKALLYLEKNVRANNADVKIVKGDVLKSETLQQFKKVQMIVSNPPYLTDEDMKNLQKEVKHEPETALFGGSDGLDFYRGITRLWKDALEDDGVLAFEIGMGQELQVSDILEENGFYDIKTKKDLAGIIRVVLGRKYGG